MVSLSYIQSMMDHPNKHRIPTLLLSAVLVIGTLGIVHNFNTIYNLTKDDFPRDGFTVELIRDLQPLRPQTAQVGGFGQALNDLAIDWYRAICGIIKICNN